MGTLKLDVFPARVECDGGSWTNVRALSDGEFLHVFDVDIARQPVLAKTVPLHPEATPAIFQMDRGGWSLPAADGSTWRVRGAGGCGCGHVLKRWAASSLMELAPAS